MRFPLLPVIVLLIFNGLIDLSLYRIIKNQYRTRLLAKIQAYTAVLLAVLLLLVMIMPKKSGSDGELLWVMWALYAYFSIYVPKYIFLIFHLISRLPALWHRPFWKWLSITGAATGMAVFVLMWWGALFNRYNIQVKEAEVPVVGLPKSFDGFTIAQISDLHTGTFHTDTAFMSKLVDKINSLHPDIIVFTGDMVNRRSEEFAPFVPVVDRLSAPYGVYSILGNHDYGDYSTWPSDKAKADDVANLKRLEGLAGMHMLNNAHDWIHVGADSIAIIGVENIGDPPFSVYGDLNASYPELNDEHVKILLSHNPAHWENDIADTDKNIALTLAGHTHAMQIELFGASPAAWRYDKWGGLYADTKSHYLYVNIGAGTVGIPARIGAAPEITLLTLKQAAQ